MMTDLKIGCQYKRVQTSVGGLRFPQPEPVDVEGAGMKSVWLACQDYGYDGWAILGVFSSEEKANSYLESRPIIVRPYQSLPNELLPSKWVIDVEGELTFVSPDQSLSGAIVEAGKRSHLYVEEWEVDEVPE